MGRTCATIFARLLATPTKILHGAKPADLPVEQPIRLKGDQSQSGEGDGADHSAVSAGHHGRGDRMKPPMSPLDQSSILEFATGTGCSWDLHPLESAAFSRRTPQADAMAQDCPTDAAIRAIRSSAILRGSHFPAGAFTRRASTTRAPLVQLPDAARTPHKVQRRV
jgi:hypothetical protein